MPEENKPSKLAALMAFLSSGTGRRLAVFLVGFLTVTLNKKFGLELDANALIADVTMVLGYVAQSAAKEASDAHAEAKSLNSQANLALLSDSAKAAIATAVTQ